jgi:hypothetical protein
MTYETKSAKITTLLCGLLAALLAAVFIVPIPSAKAEAATCGKDPNYNEYYHGETFGIYAAPPQGAGGSYTNFNYSPRSHSIPAAIQLRDPQSADSPGPYFDFQGYGPGGYSVDVTGSYQDANGVTHDVTCSVSYTVRVCQGFNRFGPYQQPCNRQGGPGGGGGGGGGGGFAISCSPFTRTITSGSSTTYSISASGLQSGESVLVVLNSSAPGVQGSPINVSSSALMPVSTTSATPSGTYSLQFSATRDDGSTAETSCELLIQNVTYPTPYPSPYPTPYTTPYATPYTTPPYSTPNSGGEFSMVCAPPNRSITVGGSTNYIVALTSTQPLSQPVGLSVTVTPSGARSPKATIVPASINPPGVANALVSTDATTLPGSYNVIVSAVYQTTVKTCNLNLTVTALVTGCPPVCPYGTPYTTPPYTSPQPAPNASLSDKDIVAVNGTINPTASSANGISDIPPRVNFKAGDLVRFKINIFNSGQIAFKNVRVDDTMFHAKAAPDPKVQFDGCTGRSSVSGNGVGVTFTLNDSIEPSTICSISFDTIVTAPPGVTEGIDRFQNVGVITGDGISKTVKTPFLLFTIGKIPTKEEVAP